MAVGYVLPEDAVSVQTLTTFPGFPGRFMPGVPLSLFHMEIEEEDADAFIEEHGLPLEKVSMSESEAEEAIDRGDGHLPSGTEDAFESDSALVEQPEPKPYSEWTVAELDAEFGDEEDYPMEENKPEKVAFAEAHG